MILTKTSVPDAVLATVTANVQAGNLTRLEVRIYFRMLLTLNVNSSV